MVSTEVAENFIFWLVWGALNWVLSTAAPPIIHQPQSTAASPLSRTEMDTARPKTRSSVQLVATEAQRCAQSQTLSWD